MEQQIPPKLHIAPGIFDKAKYICIYLAKDMKENRDQWVFVESTTNTIKNLVRPNHFILMD